MFLKSLLSVCSIFVLLLATIVFPSRAQACPVRLPETLLSLYRSSDAIYVGRFDRADDLEVIDSSENLNIVTIRRHFDISSALKGDPVKLLELEGLEYRYKNGTAEPVQEADSEDQDYGGYRAGSLKPGDLVLLFVRRSKDGETLELADSRDGIKKMNPDRLSAYEARIRELNAIFSKKKVDDTEIVEWIVRTAEDPITRWEGAFELEMSFDRIRWAEQEKADQAEGDEAEAESEDATEASSGDAAERVNVETNTAARSDESEVKDIPAEEAAQEEAADEEDEAKEEVIYARLLTDLHKQRLMNALLAGQASIAGQSKSMTAGDSSLLEVVSNWGNNVLAKYLLERLGSTPDSSSVAPSWMSTVADILGDKELAQIAEKFGDVAYEEDDAIVEPEENEDEEASDSGAVEKEETPELKQPVTTTRSSASDADETEDTDEAQAEDAAPKLTYKQLREQLLAAFMQRSVVALALAESQQMEKERAAR